MIQLTSCRVRMSERCHALCCPWLVLSPQVSAPPLIAWKYNVVPEAGSEEDKLLQVLRAPREWV